MASVGIRELKTHASEIVRRVREEGAVIDITYRGEVVARLVPANRAAAPAEFDAVWTNLDRLAAEMGARWPAGVTAEEAVSEGRREL